MKRFLLFLLTPAGPYASLLTALLVLAIAAPAFSGGWERTYGGTGSEWGRSVQQTTDGS